MKPLWFLKALGETKEVRDWKLDIEAVEYASLAPDELILIEGGKRPTDPDLFPFETAVELFVQTDPDDTGTRTRIFAGETIEPNAQRQEGFASKIYLAQNFWRKLQKDRFRQSVAIATPPGQSTTFALQTWEHVFLGYKVIPNSTPGALPYAPQRITNGQQILEALNWVLGTAAALGQPAPFQVVAAELPSTLAPVDEARTISCEEVVMNQMRWSPGASRVDYSTEPPTLHLAAYPALTPITLAIPGGAEVNVRELPHLKMDTVALTYQVRGGDGSYTPVKDVWPIGASERGFKVFAATIDVEGPTFELFTVESKEIVLGVHSPSAPNPAALAAFLDLFPEMADLGPGTAEANKVMRITDLQIAPVKVNVYARQLLSGAVPSWIGQSSPDTMEWSIYYYERDWQPGNDPNDGQPGKILGGKNVHKTKQIVTTNVASGTYRRIINAGDRVPPTGAGGIANTLLNWMGQTQRTGRLVLGAESPNLDISTGHLVNLTGGKPEWATMNAAIQRVILRPWKRQQEVAFGWPEHLDLPSMMQLYRVTREQGLLSNPQTQAGSNPSASIFGRTPIADRADGGGKPFKQIWRTEASNQVEIHADDSVSGRVRTTAAQNYAQMKAITNMAGQTPQLYAEIDIDNAIVLNSAATLGRQISINGLQVRVNGVAKTVMLPLSLPA